MKWILLLCVIFGAQVSLAQSSVSKEFNRVIQNSGLNKENLGVVVVDPDSKTLFELNADKHFIPASITKLLTEAAVLSAFGPNHKFHTQVWVDGEQSGSELKGNIYLKGGGDPAFVSEKMWMLVNDFLRDGIRKIDGKLIVDEAYFDDERVDPGREADRNDRAYDAPVGALSFNWNSTTIYVRPGERAGDKARVFIDPENEYVVLKNEVTTSKHGTDLVAERIGGDGKDVIAVRGKIAAGSEEKHIYKNITNPALYAGANFREFLKQRGVEVAGPLETGVTPSSARLVADEEGEPLSKIVTDMAKFSNNFVAEMLAKNLGAYKTGKQGHMKDGLEQVKTFLVRDLGLDEKLGEKSPKSFSLSNVSGFSRKNSFTPRQFTQALMWVQHQFGLYPEYVQSLPIAGTDGTLHLRMKNGPAEGRVRAKTGLLNGVVALSGYAGRADDGALIFTFIYNGHADEGHVREVFDQLATVLVK